MPRTTPSLVPSMRYRDAPAAIAWLERAFGFVPQVVVPDEAGGIRHSQLVCGNAMVMLGSVREDGSDPRMGVPAEVGRCTQSVYVIVEDVDEHCARARAAGAEILTAPEDQHYGGRLYSCADPEGHLWNFGSYDPFAPV